MIKVNLGLETIRTTGAPAREVEVEMVRELGADDLAALDGVRTTPVQTLKRLRDRHHQLARAIVAGMAPPVAAAYAGITGGSIGILMKDPAFIELLAFYRSEAADAYKGLHEELASISMDAAGEIRRRLEDDEQIEKIPLATLQDLVKLGADRTGFGPATKSTNVNVNVDFGARLEAARKRVAERKLIDAVPSVYDGHAPLISGEAAE